MGYVVYTEQKKDDRGRLIRIMGLAKLPRIEFMRRIQDGEDPRDLVSHELQVFHDGTEKFIELGKQLNPKQAHAAGGGGQN
jgi:hypothetical protein